MTLILVYWLGIGTLTLSAFAILDKCSPFKKDSLKKGTIYTRGFFYFITGGYLLFMAGLLFIPVLGLGFAANWLQNHLAKKQIKPAS